MRAELRIYVFLEDEKDDIAFFNLMKNLLDNDRRVSSYRIQEVKWTFGDDIMNEEERRKLFLKHSKRVVCPECEKVYRIENYRRRPAKRLIHSKFCVNPLGINIWGHNDGNCG